MWHDNIVGIECVTDVCDSHEDLVAAQDKEFKLNVVFQSILLQKSIETLAHYGGYRAGSLNLRIKVEELLRGLVLSLLDNTLERVLFSLVEELNVVSSGNGDTVTIGINLVERFIDTTPIIFINPTVVHELNTAILDD